MNNRTFFIVLFQGMVAGYFCDINSIGMAISINDFRVAIRIDNSEAKAKFDETREQIAKVREEMQKLEATG